MKAKFEKNRKFSENSGVCTYFDNNISIRMNKYGFYEEYIIDKDLPFDDKVFNVSPIFNDHTNELEISKELFSNQTNIKYKELVGYYLQNYVGFVNEGDFREKASSGGLGTWIFKELFERDLIDGVIHVKENKDKNSDLLFKYDISRSLEEIREGAKTKYYPVELSEVLNIVKSNPGRYAVIGIPGFIYSLRLLAKQDPIIKERIIYMIGLVCGHQKSLGFTESMAWQFGIKPGNLTSIDYRVKYEDRPANRYGLVFEGNIDGEHKIITKTADKIIGQDWGKGYFRLEASDYTDDVFNETADMTIGDAWLDNYKEDSKGTNIAIVRHQVIYEIFEEAIKSNKLTMDKISADTILRSQVGHIEHTYDNLPYRMFLKDEQNEWYPTKRVLSSKKATKLQKELIKLRMEISHKSHIYFLEAKQRDDFEYFVKKMHVMDKKYARLSKRLYIRKLGIRGLFKKVWKKIFK